MNKYKIVIEECSECGGTGIYVGLAERDGAGIVCRKCGGTGFVEHMYHPFIGRRPRTDIKRVYQVNPGVVIGETDTLTLESFGGVDYEVWVKDGEKAFKPGTEIRRFCCPAWWAQLTGKREPNWCPILAGESFKSCMKFSNKAKCWERYDELGGKEKEGVFG